MCARPDLRPTRKTVAKGEYSLRRYLFSRCLPSFFLRHGGLRDDFLGLLLVRYQRFLRIDLSWLFLEHQLFNHGLRWRNLPLLPDQLRHTLRHFAQLRELRNRQLDKTRQQREQDTDQHR